MTRPSPSAVDDALSGLSTDEKVFALMHNLIQRRPEALASLGSMSAAIGSMAWALNLSERYALAEVLRELADDIERARTV